MDCVFCEGLLVLPRSPLLPMAGAKHEISVVGQVALTLLVEVATAHGRRLAYSAVCVGESQFATWS